MIGFKAQARIKTHITQIVVLVALSALVGCSTFKSSKRLDMGGFAEDMIAVAGEVQYSLGQTRSAHLYEYRNLPEMIPLQQKAEVAKLLVRDVIFYSIQLVTVGDSRKPDKEKAEALAGYLEGVVPYVNDPDIPRLDLTPDEIQTILADIRAQKRYLNAINAAQPIVDEVAILSGEVFDDLKTAMEAAIDVVRQRIDERYQDARAADEMLGRRQIHTVTNIALLPQIRLGVAGAVDSLLAREPSLPALVSVKDGIDADEIQRIEDRMLDILTRLRQVRAQLEPDIQKHLLQQSEVTRIENSWSAELRKARVAIVAWARAHKRMAQGVTDPADIDVLGIARKASGSVLPLP